MATIALVSFGTHGDMQPLLVLAAALRRVGHTVRLCGSPDSAATAAEMGIDYTAFGASMRAAIERAGDASKGRAESNRGAIAFFRSQIEEQLEVLPPLLAGADLVLAASLGWGAASASAAAGVPYRYVAYTPQHIPSDRFPPMLMRGMGASAWATRLKWKMYLGATNMGFKKLFRTWHQARGLPPVRDAWRHVLGTKVFLACDEVFGALPDDTDPPVVQIGYLGAPGDSSNLAVLSERLRDFLSSGSRPVYVGFGSMSSGDPMTTAALLRDGARAAGHRLVLGSGWGRLSAEDGGDDVLVIDHEPHAVLFAQVAAVVHHGGAGTTATAARAGAPQIIVPHMGDQFFFAHQVAKGRLGPNAIPRRKLTVERLAAAIKIATTDTDIGAAVAKTASDLTATDSLARAVQAIEAELSGLAATLG